MSTYVSIAAVGRRLAVSRWTVRRLIMSGELHAVKGPGVRGHLRVSEQSVEDYLASHAVRPA